MKKDIIVINNFYEDPYAIRDFALSQTFPLLDNFPGQRTVGVPDDMSNELKNKFEEILGLEFPDWQPMRKRGQVHNTCFQLITEGTQNWVHHDETAWAAVVYLTPEPDPDSGTGFFKHIATGIDEWSPNDATTEIYDYDEAFDHSKWNCTLEIKNQFNRAIIFPGTYYHSSMVSGFGRNYIEGRLIQVFFFGEKLC